MESVFSTNWWQLNLLPGWTGRADTDSVCITKANGIGALQITTFPNPTGSVSQADVDRLASEETGASSSVTAGEFAGKTVIQEVKNRYWQKWWIACGSLVLFATYNCQAPHSAGELSEVRRMISTLRTRI